MQGGPSRPRRHAPSVVYDQVDLTGPSAFVLGSEAHGLRAEIEDLRRAECADPDVRTRRIAQRRDGRCGALLRVAAPTSRSLHTRWLRSISNSLPDAVLVVDRERRLSAWNGVAVALLGPLDGRQRTDRRAVRPPRPRRLSHVSARLAPSNPPNGRFALPVVAGTGAAPVVLAVSARLLGDEGDPDGAVIVGRPVGDAEGMAVVAAVSHELRSPLTSIKGYTSLLLSRWERLDDDQKRDMLEAVHHDAGRVTRLVDRASRHQSTRDGCAGPAPRSRRSASSCAAQSIDRLAFTYPILDCAIDFDDPFPSVWADADKVEQVLTNLIENAAKYADPTGLRIVGRVEADHVSVEVEDRGDGIRSEDLPRVFTKFFRGDDGSPSGTGLGLWISRGLAEAHGGTLDVASRPGEGSGFVLSLPLDVAESTGPPCGA